MPTSALSRIDARADVGIGPYDGMFPTTPDPSKKFLKSRLHPCATGKTMIQYIEKLFL